MRMILAAAVLVWTTLPATAAELRLLTAGAFKSVALGVIPAFEARTGHRVIVANDTAGALARRIDAGEPFDLVVLPPDALRGLAGRGRVVGALVPLARVGIGVAVKAGAARPDIGSVAAFRQMLLDAPSVAIIDPASGGSSGIYLAGLFERLGVAGAVMPKAVLVPGGLVATRVTDGRAAVAIHQISEILAVEGADLVGPLPAELQNYTVYAGGVGTAAAEPEAARALLAALASPAALEGTGMLPPAADPDR